MQEEVDHKIASRSKYKSRRKYDRQKYRQSARARTSGAFSKIPLHGDIADNLDRSVVHLAPVQILSSQIKRIFCLSASINRAK